MGMDASLPTGASVRLAAQSEGGAGPGGGITQIESTDGTVDVINPTGPIVNLSVAASGVIAKFTGGVLSSESPEHGYLADAGQALTATNIPEPNPQLYPTGARTFSVMRVTATGGGSATTSAYTVTLYKNGAPTAQQVTVPGSSTVAPGTVIADSAHPIAFGANDKFDVRWDIPSGDGTTLALAVTLEGPAGTGTAGVSSLNGLAGALAISTTKPGDSVSTPTSSSIVLAGGGLARVANLTALAALAAASFPIGNTFCWVDTVGAYYQLQTSALATTTTTVIAASGAAGARWLRMNWRNPVWEAKTAWTVNTASGNDEAAGTAGAPLKTMSEAALRLSFAQLSATTVALIGSMATTDVPTWTVSGGVFCLSIVGTTTAIFAGSVTTAVNVSAAPTTTENDLTDTSIPTSFTASGLLANGVRVAFTSGAAGRSCWIAKDNGSKTSRISQPHTAFGGNATFANGDTYIAGQLPTVRQMHFVGLLTANGVFFQTVLFPAGYQLDEQCFYFNDCWFTSPAIANNVYENCAFQGSGGIDGAGNNTNGGGIFNGGMWRGTGATQFLMYAAPGIQTNYTLTLQGVWWNLQNGSFATVQGDILCYDCTSANGPLSANYWSEMLFSAGAVGGVNNTVLASVSRMGQIAHIPSPLWLAGSATSGTPILVAGTVASPLTVAAETAGGGVVNTKQNGIYPTA